MPAFERHMNPTRLLAIELSRLFSLTKIIQNQTLEEKFLKGLFSIIRKLFLVHSLSPCYNKTI